uniref:Uncharacterized protein n=1 Tax=Cyprinus carpio TaxID=7962 RepID=A0A8C2J6C3_CYPCA
FCSFLGRFCTQTIVHIHNAVIAVFQRRDLGENELYVLNEGVRQLLKTELGSFFTEYLQNQLLTKGMVILRDKIHFYEGNVTLLNVLHVSHAAGSFLFTNDSMCLNQLLVR